MILKLVLYTSKLDFRYKDNIFDKSYFINDDLTSGNYIDPV